LKAVSLLMVWGAVLCAVFVDFERAISREDPTSSDGSLALLPVVSMSGRVREEVEGDVLGLLDLVGGAGVRVSPGLRPGTTAREPSNGARRTTLCVRLPLHMDALEVLETFENLWIPFSRERQVFNACAFAARTEGGRRVWVGVDGLLRPTSKPTLVWGTGSNRGLDLAMAVRKGGASGEPVEVAVVDAEDGTVLDVPDLWRALARVRERDAADPGVRDFLLLLGPDVPLGEWLPLLVRLEVAVRGRALVRRASGWPDRG